ncbi:MAG: enoyl-CoA hydratase/isomerase family protein [Gammaproteobacteria bacterium]|nr:MAG: enoyl-CoA hydratase/isomerase family protein [Gammaproteobacteria bacterium]
MAESQALLHEHQDGILRLTINRPERRNALSLALLDRIAAQLAAHRDDPGLRLVVVTATGERAFAAGGDLKELDAVRDETQALAMSRRGRAALDAIRDFPLPVVAALNGLALGGGAELAMACDLRVAAAHAELGFLQGRLNVTTAWGGGIDLLAAAGDRALAILLDAHRLPANEALALGLVHRVARADEPFADCVQDFLRPWLARSPGVLRGFKALSSAWRQALRARLASIEEGHFVSSWVHADHWEAVARDGRERNAGR